jgi:O-antigen/teichoic acid export membrane protein
VLKRCLMVETCPPKAADLPPIQRLSLRANFLWSLAGNIVYAACQWGILVVLAKCGSPELVGEFALALAVTAPVMIFASLSLRNVQATDAKDEYAFTDYMALRLGATLLAMLVIAGLAWAGYAPRIALIIVLIGFAKGVEFISDIVFGLLQQREQMDRIAISFIVKGVLSLAAVAAAILATGNLVLAAAALAAVWTLVLLGYDLRVAGRMLGGSALGLLAPRWSARVVWKLALVALPGGIVMALISFSGNIPRYFIEHHLGTRELGIFAALMYPIVAGSTVVAALGQSAMPRLAQHYALGEAAAFKRLLGRLLLIGLGLGVAGLALIRVAGGFLLEHLYQPEYGAYVTEFLWIGLAAGIGFVASFLGYGMTAARYFRAQVPVFAATLVAVAIACFVLVPERGLIGAAIATGVGTIVQCLGSGMVIARALRRK